MFVDGRTPVQEGSQQENQTTHHQPQLLVETEEGTPYHETRCHCLSPKQPRGAARAMWVIVILSLIFILQHVSLQPGSETALAVTPDIESKNYGKQEDNVSTMTPRIKWKNYSEQQIFSIQAPVDAFVHEAKRMCTVLLKYAKGTDEGDEPWRTTGGLLWESNNCKDHASYQLGNHLSRWYMARAIASAANAAIHLECESPVTNLIRRSWNPLETLFENKNSFSWKTACRGELQFPHASFRSGNGLDQMVPSIRLDLRNLTDYVLSKQRWLNHDLDEATIHLRTGDILRRSHSRYGIIPFYVYTQLIPKTVKTIGIVAAPFDQHREHVFYGDANWSKAITLAAKDYIQERFPDARVSIRNNANESTAITYARLISSKWSFCGSSTFCLFPALATEGDAYILQSPLFGGSPTWITNVTRSHDNVHYVEAEIIYSSEFWNWSLSEVIDRLQVGFSGNETR